MLDVRFSDTEMTADGKTIPVSVDGVVSLVELFRAAESAGHSGWSIVDCGDGDRVIVEVELEGRGENLYFAEPADDPGEGPEDGMTTEEAGEDSETSEKYVDGDGQQRLFSPAQGIPMDPDYTDERHERIVARLEKSKASKDRADKNKKRDTLICKMEDTDYHHAQIEKLIDDARIESEKKPGRGLVPISHMSKMQVVFASDVHAYRISETKFYQPFVNGAPVTLDEAKEIDLAAKALSPAPPATPAESDEPEVEQEYRCPHFEREHVAATSKEAAMAEMMCSPGAEDSGCLECQCDGPVVVEPEESGEEDETGEATGADDEVDVSDLPDFGDDDDGFLQERAG